jgi:hypothetical protein
MSQNSNSDSNSNLNSSEQAYLSLVHSYLNATRDILNGYMTLETGLTRTINSQIFRNLTRSSFMAPAPASRTSATATATATATSETITLPEPEPEPEPEPVIETPVRRETAPQIPDTPVRPAFRFRSTLPSSLSAPSSPFQIPTPVRLTSRLDTPPEERESRRGVLPLPRRAGGVSQPQPEHNLVREGGMPYASTFVRYRLPVAIGPARRVPVTNATSSENTPIPTTITNTTTSNANLRSALEMPIFSPPPSPPPPPAIPYGQTWQQLRQRRQERQQDSLSPILPVEPTPLPPAPGPLTTATRLMMDLLDTPRLNDSLVYYTQVIDREFARSREGRVLSYDVIQQQTKIVPYCTISSPLNDICPISQLHFDLIDSVMQINICKHNFNPFSLMRWFDTHSTCPMCRRQINVNIEHDDDGGDEHPIYMYNNGLPYRSESAEHRENNYHDDSDFSSVG